MKEIYIKINKSPIVLLFKILSLTIVLDFISIIIFIVDYINKSSWEKHLLFDTEEMFFSGVLILQLIITIIIFIKWIYKYYIFEENKLVYFDWIIFKKKQEFILGKIWSVNFRQTIFWKIFDYWDIIIYVQNKRFILKWINSPDEFIKMIEFCRKK